MTNEYKNFLESNFARVKRLFVLVYLNQNNVLKRYKDRSYYYNSIIKSNNIIINGKIFCNQRIDSDIKRYEDIKNLTTRQGENYTTEIATDCKKLI